MRRPSPQESASDTARWKDALLATLQDVPDAPLLLSGGMDSMSILAGLWTLGRRPDCVTYRLASTYSKDVAVATRITTDLETPLHRVLVPEDESQLREDVLSAIRIVGSRKTRVECALPMLYLARKVRELGADVALVGDPGIIEDVRAYQVGVNAANGEETEELRALRLRGYGDVGPGSAAMREAASSQGVSLVGPYSLEPIASTGLAMEPWRVNHPLQKGIALRAFPDVFGEGPRFRYWKPNRSLQTGSGLADRLMRLFGETSTSGMGRVYRKLAEGT